MPPLYRKLKALQLRQAWRVNPESVLARYREANGSVPLSTQDPSLTQIIAAILDHDDAEHANPQLMRAIAA